MKRIAKTSLGISLIGFAIVTLLPNLAAAGSLEPPALAVDGSGNPVGTMKTLDEIPPTWSQIIPGAERFGLVMGGAAVLDKETGLVWEQSPDATLRNWEEACFHCYAREVASRKGWRLPTVEELASLVDNDNNSPALPTGHPFNNVQSDNHYWSTTTDGTYTSTAWNVGFGGGSVSSNGKSWNYYVWCPRGGHGNDGY